MRFSNLIGGLLVVLLSGFISAAEATVVDFSTIDSNYANGRVERIGDVQFSTEVGGDFPDGFQSLSVGGNPIVYNYYGEQGEFFTFDNAVTLNSIDFGNACCATPTTMSVLLFDAADSLLSTTTFTWSDSWTTYAFGVSNVSKVMMNFTGGVNTYGVGRLHAWYGMDNINYTVGAAVPVPASLPLLLGGFALLGMTKRRKAKSPSPKA